MSIAAFSLRHRTIIVTLAVLLTVVGMVAYAQLGRLEYPTFTIKSALIVTPYPGASAYEVEQEVTDVIEAAVQSLGNLRKVESTSQDGLSIVKLEMASEFPSDSIQQNWDKLRRRIGDMQATLPPGAGPSQVRDDFADVYGIFFAVTGEGIEPAALNDYAKDLKRQLQTVPQVAKIELWGLQEEVIQVEFHRAKLAQLGLPPAVIFQAIGTRNAVLPAGKAAVGSEYLRISPTGDLKTVEAVGDVLISQAGGQMTFLRDVATITRTYQDPPRRVMRYDGKPAVGLGVSAVDGGNMVRLGRELQERIDSVASLRPPGISVQAVNHQADQVTASLHVFVKNLVEAVIIVVGLLLVFLGVRTGLMIGGILLVTILATFIGMWMARIDLQLISLGALILALGMLTDNAVVVADVYLVKRERGLTPEHAAREAVDETQWPLLGATVVGILAFAAIGYSPGSVGEFCRSLFQVEAISLLLSWLLAVTLTPLCCVWFLKGPVKVEADPFDKPWYRRYRSLLHACIRYRAATLLALVALTAVACWGFTKVPQTFFPDSTRRQFYVNFWRPEATHIRDTERDVALIEAHLREQAHVTHTTSFVGEGTLRFVLNYLYQFPNPSFAQVLVEVDDYHAIDGLLASTREFLAERFPDAEPKVSKFAEGPAVDFTVEARFRGPDEAVLRQLAEQAKAAIRADGGAVNLRDDWRQATRTVAPHLSLVQSRAVGVSRADLSRSLEWAFSGAPIGLFREHDKLIPILSRPPLEERSSLEDMDSMPVYASGTGRFVPLRQVVDHTTLDSATPRIQRRDRMRCISVRCDAAEGPASVLEARLRPAIAAIALPPGYSLAWGGEGEESREAKSRIAAILPWCVAAMFVLVVCMFNAIRQPLIIFLTLPLAFIGVTASLLPLGLPFGFMAILGFLGLTGMMIRNAIVLLDQLDQELAAGKPPYQAILDSAVSRMRPVLMTTGATIIGMAPLLRSPFFASMAATIMGGLIVATVLTLLIVPVLYVVFFRVPVPIREPAPHPGHAPDAPQTLETP